MYNVLLLEHRITINFEKIVISLKQFEYKFMFQKEKFKRSI